jgi:hypothetical protein
MLETRSLKDGLKQYTHICIVKASQRAQTVASQKLTGRSQTRTSSTTHPNQQRQPPSLTHLREPLQGHTTRKPTNNKKSRPEPPKKTDPQKAGVITGKRQFVMNKDFKPLGSKPPMQPKCGVVLLQSTGPCSDGAWNACPLNRHYLKSTGQKQPST